jgi:hypothetical protein
MQRSRARTIANDRNARLHAKRAEKRALTMHRDKGREPEKKHEAEKKHEVEKKPEAKEPVRFTSTMGNAV